MKAHANGDRGIRFSPQHGRRRLARQDPFRGMHDAQSVGRKPGVLVEFRLEHIRVPDQDNFEIGFRNFQSVDGRRFHAV